MSGVTVATMIRSSDAAVEAGLLESGLGGGERDVGERFVGRRRRGARESRFARRSTRRRCRRGPPARRSSSRAPVHVRRCPVIEIRPFVVALAITTCSTANVSVPRAASSPPTRASARPLPIGPRTRSRSHVSSNSSPGSTIRLKRTPSMPANSASRPRFSSWESTATAPVCAIASTISTPGMIGRPGKWPARYHSSGCTRLRATARAPGSSSTTSSMSRKGRGAAGSPRSLRVPSGAFVSTSGLV